MEFERGQDVKEALKIGRKANAIHIDCFEVWAKISLTGNPKKYGKDYFHNKTVSFYLFGEDLIEGLEILEANGICREFDDYIHDLIPKYWFKSNKDRGISLPYQEHDMVCQLKHIYVNKDQILRFSLSKKDLLYTGQLYKIAEPKDGY